MKKALVISLVVLLFSVSVFMVMRNMTETFVDNPAPYVKGAKSDPKISIFADTPCTKSCCLNGMSSGYSCDRGCICMTDAQARLLQSRGGNRSPGDEF